MPIIKAAKKAMRQTKARELKNRSQKRKISEAVKEFQNLVKAGKKEEAKKKFPGVMALLDKAAKGHLFHKNKSARKKSQLAKLVR